MSKYLCQTCKFNNHGWCNINSFNGLKKKNIQECENYKICKECGSELIIKKDFDYDKRPHLSISINEEEVFIPVKCITDFIENKDSKSMKVILDYTD